MVHCGSGIGRCLGLFGLVASLVCGPALADDYEPVNRLLRDGRLAEARSRADAYLAQHPRDPQMLFLKALIAQDSGQREAAMASYSALIQAYPELPEPYNNIAVLYASQGQYDKAREALLMATRNSRSYATAHENLGDVYARLAEQSYRQALQLDSGNSTLPPKLALIRQLFHTSAASRLAPFPGPGAAAAAAASAPR